ncbi:unnamed protein product [Urochloa humidicola]
MLLFSLPSHLSPPPPIHAEPPLQSASEPRGLRRRRNGGAGLDPREGVEDQNLELGMEDLQRRSMMSAHPPLTSTPSSAHMMNTFGGAQANH